MPRQVVVPGMHRSGTSMVAGVLHRLSVFMGERMLGSDMSNPTGHYEDLEFLAINKAILHAAGGSWRHPPSHEVIMSVTRYDQQMVDLVARRDAEHELWGWKDPRTCLTLDKWAPLLSKPTYFVCHRRPHAVMFSLMQRNRMSWTEAGFLLREYEARMIRDGVLYYLQYEQMLEDPKDAVRFMAGRLGLEPTPSAVAFIDPALDHSKVPTCV